MPIRQTPLDIQDMRCANCTTTITEALTDRTVVSNATVNFATDEARVEYNPTDVSVETLYDVIEDAGYLQRLLRLPLFGAALSLLLVFFLFEELFVPTLIPLASLGLLQPVLAAGTMVFTSVSVVTNSLLFRRYTLDHDYKLLVFSRYYLLSIWNNTTYSTTEYARYKDEKYQRDVLQTA